MNILAIKHIEIEGLGLFEEFFKKAGAKTTIVELSAGDRIPSSPENFQAVISLGGPMNVYEEKKYPFLKDEHRFIESIVKQEIPFLGICLGSQMLAKAAGACVGKAPSAEVGVYDIQLTPDGKNDPLFLGVQTPLKVFQWHEDMFEIPADGTLLARSEICPHQAVRIGKNAYGLQFHVEVTRSMVMSWIKAYQDTHRGDCDQKYQKVVEDFDNLQAQLYRVAEQIFTNFLSVIK